MRVRIEFEYEGRGRPGEESAEEPGTFYKVVDRDYVRLPAVGEGVELEPGSEGGGGTGKVTWIMWGGDGVPRIWLEMLSPAGFVSRTRLLESGWEEV